jgi:hypothetical protein
LIAFLATARRRRLIARTLLASLVFVITSFAVAEALRYAAEATRVAVSATSITSFDNRDPSKTRFGALEFIGGLALTSSYQPFGGISALHMEPDGARFFAITDNGSWLRGRIVYKDGKPDGIADTEMAPILGADGQPLAARNWYDVESLTESGDYFYIGIERVERILRFNLRRDGFSARGEEFAVPPDFKSFTYNKSLECLAAPPKGSPLAGRLIAVTEHSLDKDGNHRSFVLAGSRQVTRFSVKRSDDFDISDCTILPPGDLLLLERRYSVARGVATRIRRVPLAAIKDGALIDGPALIEADLAFQIDNMEGIGIHRNAQGETILTLISDDNFSVLQRNLLLQFRLVD